MLLRSNIRFLSDSISHRHHLPQIGHRPLSFFRISQPSWIIYLTPGSLFLHSRLPSLATLYVPSPRVFRTLFLFWNSLTLFSHFSSYLRVFQTVFPLLKHSHAFLTQAHSYLRVFQILFLVWNTLTAPWCMLCWHFWYQSTNGGFQDCPGQYWLFFAEPRSWKSGHKGPSRSWGAGLLLEFHAHILYCVKV